MVVHGDFVNSFGAEFTQACTAAFSSQWNLKSNDLMNYMNDVMDSVICPQAGHTRVMFANVYFDAFETEVSRSVFPLFVYKSVIIEYCAPGTGN